MQEFSNGGQAQGGQEQTPAPAPQPQPAPQFQSQSGIQNMPKKPSRSKKLLLWGSVVVGLLIVVALVFAWLRLSSTDSIAIEVILPERVQVGVPFAAEVQVSNGSNTDLRDARLSVSLPSDIAFVGSGASKVLDNRSLESIASGVTAKEQWQLIALSTEDAIKQLRVTVSYLPGRVSSRFEQAVTKDIVLGSAAVALDITTGNKVLAGEAFNAIITYENRSQTPYENVVVRFITPTDYVFESSEPEASRSIAGGKSWEVAELPLLARGEITARGSYSGATGSNFDLRAIVSAKIGDVEYAIAEKVATITVAESPLALEISLDGGNDRVVEAGQGLKYTLRYRNNTDVGLRDAIISARFEGEMFDLKQLQTDGVLRGSDNAVVWNASRVSELANIAPGASGSVSFTIRTKDNYPITTTNSKNFLVTVRGEMESPTVPRFVDAERTVGFVAVTNKVRGQVALETVGFQKEPTAQIVNTGPVPPKVGQATQYTIHWRVANYSTDIANAKVKAFLGPNVRFTGVAQSTTGVLPTYNERTQEMSWEIAKIAATRGVLSDPVEAVFQVELIPSVGQVGKSPMLIQESSIVATDSFTGVSLSDTGKEVDISLPADSTISGSEGRVAE